MHTCEFQFGKEFGDRKTDAWLKSGAHPYSGEKITKSLAQECRAHQMPISWTKNDSKKVDAQTLEADGDATEEDKINFQSLRDVASGWRSEAAPLKVERLSPDDEVQHKRKTEH